MPSATQSSNTNSVSLSEILQKVNVQIKQTQEPQATIAKNEAQADSEKQIFLLFGNRFTAYNNRTQIRNKLQ